jgi:predicted porin
MMKKVLLGSTALVGASVLMAGTALAADPPALKLSGYMRFETWFADQDTPNANGSTANDQGYHFEIDDAELHLNAGSTADNGLRYSMKVEIDLDQGNASNGNPGIDEATIRFAGNWGILDLGDEDGVQNLMDYDAATVLTAGGGFDGGSGAIFNFAGARQTSPDIAAAPGDATKITYYTPRVMGVQAGVSFTPDTGSNLGAALTNNDGTTQYRNMWSYGVNYVEKYGDVGVAASLVGIYSEDGEFDPGTGATQSTQRIESATGYAIGGRLSWKEWSLGAGWMNSGAGGLTEDVAGDSGQQWNVGLGWKSGPYAAHLAYFSSEADRGTGVDDDNVDFITVGAQYNLSPGLDVYGEVDFIDVDRQGTANDNDGIVFMLGTRLSF